MSQTVPPLMRGINQAMSHLSQRQHVIAQNIANADTPAYKARELEAPSFAYMVDTGGARVARPTVQLSGAMKALGATQQVAAGIVPDRDVTETKPDGNNVTLEEQVMKLGAIQAEFAALTNLYRKQMQLMKTATGRNGSG